LSFYNPGVEVLNDFTDTNEYLQNPSGGTMADFTKPTTDHENCPICKHIPDHKFVETLHTDARLPEQVDQLEILGGYGLYGHEQVRKCPLCKTYYTYLSDHDSESGVGCVR
jgi:hypothetical protein